MLLDAKGMQAGGVDVAMYRRQVREGGGGTTTGAAASSKLQARGTVPLPPRLPASAQHGCLAALCPGYCSFPLYIYVYIYMYLYVCIYINICMYVYMDIAVSPYHLSASPKHSCIWVAQGPGCCLCPPQ